MEDPLDDTGLVQQQLDQLSTIGRCEYEKTCALLVQLFDQSAQSYQELLQSATASPMDVAVQEGEHAWRRCLYGIDMYGCGQTLPRQQRWLKMMLSYKRPLFEEIQYISLPSLSETTCEGFPNHSGSALLLHPFCLRQGGES